MKTIEFLKEVHDAKDVWFYFEDTETKQRFEEDFKVNLQHCDKAIRYDNDWIEVSSKLFSIYKQCGPQCIFGGIVFVYYKKYLNHEPYFVKR